MDETYKNIQTEFFDVLENSKLFSEVKEVEKGKFALSETFPTESNALRVKTSKGWQPTPVQWVESLLNDISIFWNKNAHILYEKISKSQLEYIQTEPILFQKGIRKFGCFFDAVIIPDQLLILYNEHVSERPLTDWQSLVLSVVRTGVTYLENKDLLLPKNKYPKILIVPPKRIIDKGFSELAANAVLTMSCKFFSELCNNEIKHPLEFVEIWIKNGEKSMDRNLLNRIYKRYGASSFNEYFQKQQQQCVSEHGTPTILKHEPKILQMIIDVNARFSEFERSHGEAFILGQEAEIPDDDIILFEWWFNESSKTLSSISGTRLSEDEVIKLGIQSKQMSFLRDVKIKNLIELLETDPIEKLRKDFKFSRLKIKRLKEPKLQETINTIGDYMEESLRKFQEELANVKVELRRNNSREWVDFGASMIITAASVLLPPLSAFSAIYGGNLTSINKNNKKSREIIHAIKERPIATLADWKFTTKSS